MCSINGFSFHDKKLIENFLLDSNHRGPELSNIEVLDNFTFGFNLLPIDSNLIDGKQPLISDKYILLFNGEIYNKISLANKYQIEFFRNDTHLLFILLNKIGLKVLEVIEGIYAIFILCREKKKIYLIRDIFGSKPLYYTIANNKFLFSSYIDNLVKFNKSTLINKNSLNCYLTFGYNFHNETLLNNINLVPKNKIVELDYPYNKINLIEKKIIPRNIILTKDEFSNEIKSSFHVNQKKQGLLLSGGVDSNIIFNELIDNNFKPTIFSTKFIGAKSFYNDDFDYAEKISTKFKLEFRPIEINQQNFIDNSFSTYSILDQPILNINSPVYYQTFLEIKKNNIKSILSGDGGDELYYGYPWQKIINSFEKFKFFKKTPGFTRLSLIKLFIFYKFSNYQKIFHMLENLNFFNEYNLDELKNYMGYYKTNNLDFLTSSIFFKLCSDFLMLKDNLGMNFSIETRYPLLQEKFLLNSINSKKNISFFDKKINKPYLYSLYKDQIPKDIFLMSKKRGWSVPRSWLEDENYKKMQIDIILNKLFKNFLSTYGHEINIINLKDNIKYRTLLFSLFLWLEKKSII